MLKVASDRTGEFAGGPVGTAQERSVLPLLAPKPPVAPGAARDLLSALRASDGFPVPHRQSLLAVGTRRLRVLAIGVVGAAVESAAALTRPRHEAPLPAFGAVRIVRIRQAEGVDPAGR